MTIPTAVGGGGGEQGLGAALCRRFATEGYHASRSWYAASAKSARNCNRRGHV
jgi:hypothetical protein